MYNNSGSGGGYYFSQPYPPPFYCGRPEFPDELEKRAIKRCYRDAFLIALFYSVGTFILAQIVFLIMMGAGYEFRYTEDNTAIVDWVYNLAGSAPSLVFCLGIFLFDKGSAKIPARAYVRSEKITFGVTVGFFGAAAGAYAIAVILQNIVISAMFAADVSPIKEEYLTQSEVTPLFLMAEVIFTAILPPICEELLFRGVILRRLSSVSQSFAIFVSAALFGLMHGNLLQAILGFIMGIVFGFTAVKTGSLILPIAGHIFCNGYAVSAEFARYYIGETAASSYETMAMVMFLAIGTITFTVLAVSGNLKLPPYNEYHRRRTFPIMIGCVSFWILLAYYVVEVVGKFGPVTEKLLGS